MENLEEHNLSSIGPRLTPKDIKNFEDRIYNKMPEELKDLYLQYNGAFFRRDLFVKEDIEIWLKNILDIGLPIEGLESICRIFFTDANYPIGFFPFAVDHGGNCIVYSIREKDYGAIFFVNNDYFDVPELHVRKLTSSLSEFFDLLEVCPP